jgi:hypothetical protein
MKKVLTITGIWFAGMIIALSAERLHAVSVELRIKN